MPRPDRKSEILAAATRLFAASGFNGVSIDDLGAELGISGPAIYRYFSGKEAILAEMLVVISQQLLDGAKRCLADDADPSAQLAALIDFHVDFALGEPDLIAVQFRDLGSAPLRERQQVRKLQRMYVNLWADVFIGVHPGLSRERALSGVQAVFGLLNSTPHSGRVGDAELKDVLPRMAAAALAAVAEPGTINDR